MSSLTLCYDIQKLISLWQITHFGAKCIHFAIVSQYSSTLERFQRLGGNIGIHEKNSNNGTVTCAGSMLDHRLRLWPSINPSEDESLMLCWTFSVEDINDTLRRRWSRD